MLRIGGSAQYGYAWTEHIALLPALAVFYLLMLKPYPHRGWVHISTALITLSIALKAYPFLTSAAMYLLTGMALANFYLCAGRGLGRVEQSLCQRLGVRDEKYSEVVGEWSLAALTISGMLVGVQVIVTVITTVFQSLPSISVTSTGEWWGILLTLLLTASYVLLNARFFDANKRPISLHATLLLIVWWCGAPSSPLMQVLGVSAPTCYPLVTAAFALVTALTQRHGSRLTGHWSLVIAALVFTKGVVNLPTVVTLLLATATFAVLTLTQRRAGFAYAGSAAFVATCLYAVLLVARFAGVSATSELASWVALSAVVSAFALLPIASWLQMHLNQTAHTPAHPHAHTAIEHVAFSASLLSAIAVIVSAADAATMSGNAILIGVSALLSLTVFYLLLAQRWNAEWLVYAAQTAFVGSYLYYRATHPMSPAQDAVVLVIFCFLDFTLSQALEQLHLNLYARPTLRFSLLLPLLPLALTLDGGQWTADINLLIIFSTATFYGVVCYQKEWKSAGYAAAVFYNAFLWLVWARAGVEFARHPQFYLIPVGLSAILFAEANRGELHRQTLNAIRSLGLMVMYVSTAIPLWQFQSFGAWLTLLLLSLGGIFVGIGLRLQAFLWMGLTCFVFDVVYQLGRIGMEHVLARWAIMLGLGILLVLFVALNEKKRIVATMRAYYEQVRQWE